MASAQGTAIFRDESSLSATPSFANASKRCSRVELLGAYTVVSHQGDVHGRRGPGHLHQLTACDLFTGSPTGGREAGGRSARARDSKHWS